jgi:hypothetical protein
MVFVDEHNDADCGGMFDLVAAERVRCLLALLLRYGEAGAIVL